MRMSASRDYAFPVEIREIEDPWILNRTFFDI